ncbi:MAG: hypothetical protein GWP05_04130 [Anaerolineaceae bacterium]|nr:hypothetical protein [Anaerolineaceae bacterium]
MAAQTQNPFTNTKLMLAGLVCGAIGVMLAIVHINRKVTEKVGEEVTVYVMKQDLPTDKELQRSHYEPVSVRKSYVKKAYKVIYDSGISKFLGARPAVKLSAGEPLVATWFDDRVGRGVRPAAPAGSVEVGVRVDPRHGLGQNLDVGSIVSLRGLFKLGPRGKEDSVVVPLRLLHAVQVESINGMREPDERTRRNVSRITIYVGSDTSRWLSQLDNDKRMEGFFRIEGMPPGTRRSEPNKEIPKEALSQLREALGK